MLKDSKQQKGFRPISLMLFITLFFLASWAVLTPNVMADWPHDLNSTQDNAATENLGTITINGTKTFTLPDTDLFWDDTEHQITYDPEEGYAFVRWETGVTSEVDDPNSQTTILTTHDASGHLTAVYRQISRPVGGYATSVNKSAIVAPYITLLGLIGIMSTIFAIRRWRKD